MCGMGPSSKEQDKYRAEDDSRTLMRADEIRNDKGRLGNARAHVRGQMKAMGRVAGSDSEKPGKRKRGRKRSSGRR